MSDEKQLKRAALNLKREREDNLLAIDFPDNKTGEMNKLKRAAKALAACLDVYDAQSDPPPIADMFRDTFNETVSLLTELTAPKTDAPA